MKISPNNIYTITLSFISLILFSCVSDNLDDNSNNKNYTDNRVVIAYFAGDNSLTNELNADFEEMISGCKNIPEGDKLIVFIDDETSSRIYEINNKTLLNPEPICTFDSNLDSSDPQTLETILNWIKRHYDAKEYALLMSSHGDAWLPSLNTDYQSSDIYTIQAKSFGVDVGDGGNYNSNTNKDGHVGTEMDIEDMAYAIDQSGLHLKYIFFDACLMQNIETAYELRNVTDYIIACPIMTTGLGAYYVDEIKVLFGDSMSGIAQQYYTSVTTMKEYIGYGLVISVLKTEELDLLATTMKVFLPKIINDRKSLVLSDTQKYLNGKYNSHRPDFYDMQDVMKKFLEASDYELWKKIFDKCLIYKVATETYYVGDAGQEYMPVDLSNYSGISMFIPQDIYDSYYYINSSYGNLNDDFQKTNWYNDAGWSTTGW